jgi:hypothetical protein
MTDSKLANRPEGVLFLETLDLGTYHDIEGRPLSENKAPEECRRGVQIELAECRYSGRRFSHAKPMNISALQQMVKNWPEVIGALNFIRNLYLPDEDGSEISLLSFWKIARTASLVPSYLIYRGKQPFANREIPAFVAALYKASLGLFDTAQAMALRGTLTGEYNKDSMVNVEAIFDFAENQEVLIGAKEVCAGPPNLIREAIRAITDGGINPSKLKDLIPEQEDFLRYANCSHKVYLLNFIFPFHSFFSLIDLFQIARNEGPLANATSLPAELSRRLVKLENSYPDACLFLHSMGKSFQAHYLNSLCDVLTSIDEQPQMVAAVRGSVECGSEENERVASLLLESADSGATDKPCDSALRLLARSLAIDLAIERKRLKLCTITQAEANEALGRKPVARELAGSDLTRTFGITLRDVVSEYFGIHIEHRGGETVLQKQPPSIVVD